MYSTSIPAYDRYHSGSLFNGACRDVTVSNGEGFEYEETVLIYPNPISTEMTIESSHRIQDLTVINALGQIVYSIKDAGFSERIDASHWSNGVYVVLIGFIDEQTTTKRILKTNSY